MMKTTRLLVAVSLLSLSSAPAWALKVGVVNMQRALQESKKGRAAKSSLEKEVEDKRKKIDGERSAIQKASEEFQKKSAVMSEKARTQKGTELQQKVAALQELMQKAQFDVQNRERELTAPILEALKGIVPDIAKKHKAELVLEESAGGFLYSSDKVDLTEEVIKAYDDKP